MSKEILYDEEALLAIAQGATLLARAVKTTYGPAGRQVAIAENGSHRLTSDGATVAASISSADPALDLGVQLLQQASKRTATIAGDGSTTTVVLAERMIRESVKAVTAGLSPLDLKRGLLEAHQDVQREIARMSRQVTAPGDIQRLAANFLPNDAELGELLAQAFQQHGKDAIVEVVASSGTASYMEAVDGTEVEAALLSPYLATEPSGDTAAYADALVLVTDQRLDSVRMLVPLLAKAADARKPLLIIAREVAPEVLSMLVTNRLNGSLQVAAVKLSAAGDRFREQLEDLALLSGTEVISTEKGQQLQQVSLEQLGGASKVTAGPQYTRLQFPPHARQQEKDEMLEHLRTGLSGTNGPSERAALEQRLKVLGGSFVQLSVGAKTESELKIRMQQVKGAVKTVQAALEEGVVPGGGIAYLDADWMVIRRKRESDAAQVGANIMLAALKAPFIALLENAGLEALPLVAKFQLTEMGTGFDLRLRQTTNMWEAGIQDPAKVARVALQSAVSVVSELIATSAAVVETVEKESRVQTR